MRLPLVSRVLTHAARRAQAHPEYLGWILARYVQWENITEQSLAELLGCAAEDFPHLSLCLRPRADHFAEDVRQISSKFHLHVGQLAAVIRLVESIEALASRETQSIAAESGFLMAARTRKRKRTRRGKEDHNDQSES